MKIIHANLVELWGQGVLLRGEPGIGKSEATLKLIERQHYLVADDAVAITVHNNSLNGQAPFHIRGQLYHRKLGLINIKDYYQPSCYIEKTRIKLAIKLVKIGKNGWEKLKLLKKNVPEYTMNINKINTDVVDYIEDLAKGH